jgi:AcrR family transcriptional regulator
MAVTAGERSGGDTKQRILVAALECFANRGYAGTSIRDLAERMGVTKAALYYHFASKEEILDALTEPAFTEIRDLASRAAEGADAREVLSGLVDILSRRAALIRTVMGDPSVPRKAARPPALDQLHAIADALAPEPGPAGKLVARAALGAAQFGAFSTAMLRATTDPRFQGPTNRQQSERLLSGTEHLLSPEERATIVDAALRALHRPEQETTEGPSGRTAR